MKSDGNDISRRQIRAQQFGEEQLCLFQRGEFERLVQLVIVVDSRGRRGVVDLAQVEPVVSECVHEAARLRVVEQPLGLLAQHLRLVQLTAFGAGAQRGVWCGVPEEKRQARGESPVVELARLLLDEHEARRDQHAGVGGEHRAREAGAELELPLEQPEEPLHFGFLDGPPVSRLDETAQQPLGVLLRGLGEHFDRHVADGIAPESARPANAKYCSACWTTDRWTDVRRHDLQRHPAFLTRAEPPHRQVVEQQLVAICGMCVFQRPRDFQPLHGVAGHALLRRERIHILLVGAVHARAEEPHRVGADALPACELHFDLAHGRPRREIHDTDGPRLA